MNMKRSTCYQKPEFICQDRNQWGNTNTSNDFIQDNKKRILDIFANFDFNCRLGAPSDVGVLDTFVRNAYRDFGQAVVNDLSPYDIYRFTKYGNAIILERDGILVGCIFEIGYDTPERSSFTIRLAIDPKIRGANLGFLLLEYSCLLAMERGSTVKRGLLEIDNLISCNILVNKMGWICEGLEQKLSCGIENGFSILLPLDPKGFLYNRIDEQKLIKYITTHREGKHYLLIDCDDMVAIQKIYQEGFFIIVAYVKKGWFNNKNLFFAMPVEMLLADHK